VTFTRDAHHLPSSQLRLRRVSASGWAQSSLTDRDVPALGRTVASASSARSMRSVTFRLRGDVTGAGRYGFALTSNATTDAVRFGSRESANPPKLSVRYTVPVVSMPKSPSGGCRLSVELVPSCGVLFGGVTTSWGGSTVMSQYTAAQDGTGSHIVLSHDYRRPGQVLSPYDVEVAQTPGAILQLNWKPSYAWGDSDGSDASVNSQIDAMAASIKSLGSTKIFLTIFHEPENDVTSDPNCPNVAYKGSAGTPTQYRGMWANVESRFAADGVSNVVWDMNYMNYPPWDCLVNDLWPGNSLVDWVMFESYSTNTTTFATATGHFYDLLTSQSDAAHDYLSKPWGIGEFGTSATTASVRDTYYSGVKTALDTNEFPKLKFLSVFDAVGIGGDYRVAYTDSSQPDPASLADFMTLLHDPTITTGDNTVDGS
jgi:hypothetical protein